MKGFKMFSFNVLAALLPVFEAADFTDVLGNEGMAWYAFFIAVTNTALRAITTTPIFKRK